MFREKLIDKKHLKQIQEEAFKFEERIERGEIDAEKTAAYFYRTNINTRLGEEIFSLIFLLVGVAILSENLLSVYSGSMKFDMLTFILLIITISVGCLGIVLGAYVFFRISTSERYYQSEYKIFFKEGG